jgi:penicillin-binding protein 1A
VVTSVDKRDQEVAVGAVRKALVGYDRMHGYRGPEGFVKLPGEKEPDEEVIKEVVKGLSDKHEAGMMWPAGVLEAGAKKIVVWIAGTGKVELTGADALELAAPSLSAKATKERKIVRGSIIRVEREGGKWRVAQIPEVAAAFVAADTKTGAIKALVGGFDFSVGKFNRAVQAFRQPGSSFKPFVYSAALEKGLSPSTVINDEPFVYDPGQGGEVWEPKNYDGKNAGPMSMRSALTASKNMVSARIIKEIGPLYAQQYATRFGFDSEKNPPVLALGLGAGSVTPLQMATAYSVFANGGYKVDSYLVSKVLDGSGKVLFEARPAKAGEESRRVIEEANAFVMDTMLKDVAQKGTAAKASATLKRQDLGGKTGTTNDSMDAWFAGYHPDIVGVAWMGFDHPKSLGSRETGGGLALPIWIDYMEHALKNKQQGKKREVPEGVVPEGFYRESLHRIFLRGIP